MTHLSIRVGLVVGIASTLGACTGPIPPPMRSCPEVEGEEVAVGSSEEAVAAVRAHLTANLPAFEIDASKVRELDREWYVDNFRVCKTNGEVENALRL